MDPATALFDRMDEWRHFPNYQLERRADIFFSLYLPRVLEAKLGFAVSSELAPEFPVRIGTIYPSIETDKSYKIDYLAMSADGSTSVFVELKSEGASRRESQDKYLLASQGVGLPALLEGVRRIFRVTNSKRKYFALMLQLEHMGLLQIPEQLKALMLGESLQGVTAASDDIVVTAPTSQPRIIYVQPVGDGPDVISFEEFASVVEREPDPVSQRFAQSLREWASVPAGR